jgi:hypothetical protein
VEICEGAGSSRERIKLRSCVARARLLVNSSPRTSQRVYLSMEWITRRDAPDAPWQASPGRLRAPLGFAADAPATNAGSPAPQGPSRHQTPPLLGRRQDSRLKGAKHADFFLVGANRLLFTKKSVKIPLSYNC